MNDAAGAPGLSGAPSAPLLSAADLVAAGRTLSVPFIVRPDPQPAGGKVAGDIHCVEMLRLLPGRRVVARARMGDSVCVVKLFFGPRAGRYFRRERRGLARLAACGVPTPRLLAGVSLSGGAGFGLVLEWLAGAAPVAEDDHEAFVHIVGALGRLHNGSSTRTDPHLDNYLKLPDGRVFAIDGDGVRRWPVLLRWQALANLGLLLAQFPPSADGHLLAACAEYDRVRWQTSLSDAFLAEVRGHLRRQRRRRTRRYLTKTLRECTEFHCERMRGRFLVCARNAWNPAMAAFAQRPEGPFADAGDGGGEVEVLKAGNSATVVRAPIGGQTYVIKRYNVKSRLHGLRRALRPVPRYRVSWRNGHRLSFLRLRTARPVALLECRTGWFATVAYLVMEDLGPACVDLAARVATDGASPALTAGVVEVFVGLAEAELVHGDTKASNFLLRDGEIHLIDLDAMAPGRRGMDRDLARFLANWDSEPQVREQFRAALQAALRPKGMPL